MMNIFVAHTPFHVFMAETLVNNHQEISKCKNVLLLEFNPIFKHVNHNLWSEVVLLEHVDGHTYGHQRFLMSERNIEVTKKIIDGEDRPYLFISDIAWPMNNRLFFDAYLREKVTFCLISDGLGLYALPKVTTMLLIRGLVKYLNGVLHWGVAYRNYTGSVFGVDRKEVKYIYALNVKLIDCDSSKKKEILVDSIGKTSLDKSKCILLDQPGWLLYKNSDWNLMRETTVNFFKSLDVHECFYKNHQFGRREEEVYYEKQGFNIIDSNKCAEQIIAEEGFGTVVSYQSSALFNLKSMYQNKIRCISLFSRTWNSWSDYNENKPEIIIDLFNKVNVEIVITP